MAAVTEQARQEGRREAGARAFRWKFAGIDVEAKGVFVSRSTELAPSSSRPGNIQHPGDRSEQHQWSQVAKNMKTLFLRLLLCLSVYLSHLSCGQAGQNLNPILASPCQVALLVTLALLAFVWGSGPGDLLPGFPSECLNFPCGLYPPAKALSRGFVLSRSHLSQSRCAAVILTRPC